MEVEDKLHGFEETEDGIDRLPKSAFSLYINLYCRKKELASINKSVKRSKEAFKEATKSWFSLSKKERKQFTQKYNLCREKYRKSIADYLSKAIPYMKKRSSNEKCTSEKAKPLSRATTVTPDDLDLTQHIDTECVNVGVNSFIDKSIVPNEFSEENVQWDANLANTESTCDRLIYQSRSLPEPSPPNVKSAQELFELTKTMKNINEKVTWHSLTLEKKTRYRNAVLSLKKDYINKYKAYLDSLSSEDLYNYYKNKI